MNSWQSTTHFKNDARNSKKILLSFNRNIFPKLGRRAWNLHPRQTHKEHTNRSRNNPHPRLGKFTRRSQANLTITRTTAKCRSRECHHSNWSIFEIRVSSFQPHGSEHSKTHFTYHDKARLSTYTHYNRRKKSFRFSNYTWSSRNTRHILETNHNKTCTNNRGPRAGPCYNQDFFENGIGWIQETMAQVFTYCNPELQHHIAFQDWRWTEPNISWQIPAQHPRQQTGTDIRSQFGTYHGLCRWTTPQNSDLITQKQEKRHAGIHQLQKLIKKKKKLPPKAERNLFLASTKGRPTSVKNAFSWLSLDCTLFSGKSATEQWKPCPKTQY